tara:strand:- start:132 stop:1367 length:1236 start_codon:yes stop_codon:yes gene_type:complete
MLLVFIFEYVFSKDLNTRIIIFFLFLYFFIPFLNISSYRGTIEFDTLILYCSSNILVIISLLIFSKKRIKTSSIIYIDKSPNLYVFTLIHISFAYILLAYTYFRYGNIFSVQETRFVISPTVGYIIKSTIYIPLIFILLKTPKNYLYYLVFIFLPLMPAFLIGSRGTVIMIIIGVLLLLLLMNLEKAVFFNRINKSYTNIKRKHFLLGSMFSIFVLYSIFYVRRAASKVYISSAELIKKYFDVKISPILVYLILPLYLNLRETVGITNQIIQKDLNNTNIIPMFLLELFTVLPGKQDSPGIILGNMIGRVGDAGLTPGILGGLYLDIGFFCVLFPMFFVMILCYFYKKSQSNDIFKIVYVLSLVQFFHLYHRGFLKLEYFMSFLIIFIYLLISGSFRIKNEDTSHSIPISS